MTVRDTGTGMDEATLKRAAEPFFTTKGTGKGTGLGLSMVYGLAAQSGGVIRIQSRPGAGTTVELWLPVAEAGDAQRPRPATATLAVVPTRSFAVLLVDDDPMVSSGTSAMLQDLGHSVVTAPSAALALDVLRSETPVDLVITDHAMPGMTGTELAKHIRGMRPDLPIILATGYAEVPNNLIAGMPRLDKPYRLDKLAATIAAVLDERALDAIPVPLNGADRAEPHPLVAPAKAGIQGH